MIKQTEAPWDGIALVCRKCSKKLGGGFGPGNDEKLAKTLRQALRAAGRRRALRIVEVGCLGLCPRKAVTLASPTHPGALFAIPRGTSAEATLAALGITPPA